MTPDEQDDHDGRMAPARRTSVTDWPVWELPGRLLVAILTVEATALLLVATGLIGQPPPSEGQIRFFALVTVLGVLHTELAFGIERVRRRINGEMHVNMSSVWFFAAVVLLPPAWAATSAVVVHTHLWLRSTKERGPRYRHVFSTATTALSCVAASAVMTSMSGDAPERTAMPVVVMGILVYITVNTALVAGAIAVSSPRAQASHMIGEWHENLLEIATLCLGALAALSLLVNVWLVAFVLPPLLVLHRAILVRHLERAASTDGKTGLLNAAAWHTQAERELRRAERREGPRAVLVVDLDHFKAVNDTHGHLAGDHVLAAVADALRSEVRDRDLVGRFGGEEFVVLLGEPGGDGPELEAVAERIRRRIASLRVEMPTADGPLTVAGLSASVGGSLYPGDGRDLRTLLHVADTALYAAKRSGRNAVRLGIQLPAPTEPLAQPVGPRASAEPPVAY